MKNKNKHNLTEGHGLHQARAAGAFGVLGFFTRVRALLTSTLLYETALIAVAVLFVPGSVLLRGALGVSVYAQTPNTTVNYQARLLSSSGALVADGNYHIEFKIYDAVSAGATAQGICTGNCLWMETRTTGNLVRVVNGYVSVNLGSVTAFGSTIPWGQDLYVTMRVGGSGGSPSWDSEMTNSGNRMKLSAVPYAFTASSLRTTNRTSTNSDAITIQTGSTTTSGNSGNITIDTGTAAGTAGTILLGTTTQSGLTLGRSGAVTALNGNAASSISFTNFGVTAAGAISSTTAALSGANALTLGTASSINGAIVLRQSSSAFTATIQAPTGALSASSVISLPSSVGVTDTFCLQTLNNCPGNSKFTDSGTFTYLTSTTDDLAVGASTSQSAKLAVVGDANETQLLIKANATQSVTNPLVLFQNSSGTEISRINIAGTRNQGFGLSTLNALTTGTDNTGFGYNTLLSVTDSIENTAFGSGALDVVATGGHWNIGIGVDAGGGITSGDGNTAVGTSALMQNTSWNTAVGRSALQYTSGSDNVAVGATAGTGVNGVSTFGNSVLVGSSAGTALTTGSNNIFLGFQAGNAVTTGSNNIVLGYDIDPASATGSNQLNIANILTSSNYATGNLVVGTSDTTGQLLTLDTKTSAGDPTGVNGGLYYNSNAGKFRCYEAGAWKDCDTSGGVTNYFTDSGTLTYLTSSTDQLSIGSSSDLNGKLQVVNDDAADSALVIRAAASQSAPLIVAQDSAGTDLFAVRSNASTNLFLGVDSGYSVSAANENIGIGLNSLGSITTANGNIAVGNYSQQAGNADSNVSIGHSSLASATLSGGYNVALGNSALQANETGSSNVALGRAALGSNEDGGTNTAVGNSALSANIDGSNNVALGFSAGAAVEGSNNIFLGYQAGDGLTSGDGNIILGYDIDFANATGSNQLNIAGLLTSTDYTAGNLLLGTSTTAGTFRISDGSSNSVGINTNSLAGDYTVSIPTITANDTFCLFTLNNCVNANAFVQNGNSFTGAATLGTNDAYTLAFETNNITRITLDTSYKAYFGNGATNATPQGFTLQGTSGSGTNITGAGLTIASGQGTGTGTSGNITFQYAPAGASGSSLNALQAACTISGTNGSLSCPGAGSDSERFGAGATAGGSQAVALGKSASAGGNISTAIGYLAVANTYGSTVLGYGANAPGTNSLALGVNATGNTDAAVAVGFGAISGQNGSSLGYQALSGFAATALGTNTSANNFGSIAIGSDAATTAANQLVVGGNSTAYISDAYFGSGITSANAASRDFKLQVTSGSGTNIGGADFTLAAGQGTGTGVGGAILFQTAAAGASGSSLNALTTRAEIQADGDLAVDTNTLFVDATNNRVGVGLTNPASPLEVVGAIRSSSTAGQGSFEVRDTGSLSASLYDGSGAGNVGILDLYSGGTNNVRLRADTGVSFINAGNFGVGDVSPASKLVVSGDANDAIFGNIVRVTGNLTSSTNGQFGIGVRPSVVPSSASTQEYVGLYTDIQATASNVSGATIVGFKSNAKLGTTATSALQNVYGFMANPTNSNTTYTLTNNVGFYSQNPGSTGVITNNYGVFIESQTRGTNDYGIYVQGADTYALWSDSGANRFDGVTTIGADSTTTALTVTGGGADAAVATSTSGILVLGATNSTNIVMDADEIIARNNGATSTLNLQSEGGATILGAATNARAQLNVSGHAAIGSTAAGAYTTTSTSMALHVSEDFTDTSGALYGIVSRARANPGSSSTAGYTGVFGQALLDTDQNAGSLTGGSFFGQINAALTGANTVTTLYGVRASVGAVNGSGSSVAVIPTATAFEGQVDNRGLSITSARGATLSGVAVNGGTITNSFGLLVNQGSIGTGGGITSQVGVAIASHGIGTNNTELLIGTTTPVAGNYSLYSSSANASFFNGTVDVNFNGAVTVNGVCHSGADIDAATNVSRTLVACSAAPNDYAEFYPAEAGVEAGDIVATTNNLLTYEASGADPETGIVHSLGTKQISIVKKAILGDSSIGIISTAPYQTIGKDIPVSANRKPLALSGRVPVKVNNQGGAIAVGDKITVSTVAGVGKKATEAGFTVGTALEPFNGINGTIYVLVNNSYFEPPVNEVLQGASLSITGNSLFGGDISVGGNINVSGAATVDALVVTGTSTLSTLVVTGATEVSTITVRGKIITAGATPTVVLGANTVVGQNGSVSVNGNDTAGTIVYTSGVTAPPAYSLGTGAQLSMTFNSSYATIPRIALTPKDAGSASVRYYVETTATGMTISFLDAPSQSATYSFDYFIVQ